MSAPAPSAPSPSAPLPLPDMAARAGEAAALLRTLAHPARLMIVCTLVEGERSVGDLEEALDLHQPNLSQQLTILRRAGLVRPRRAARQIYYRLAEDKAARLVAALYQIFCSPEVAP